MLKCFVIINPSSGKIRYKEYLPELTNVLKQKFSEIELVYTEKKGDGIHYGLTTDADTVIVVGGDGTIREVVNGLMQQKYIPKLGIIPAGTVNDLARALNIPLDPFQAIAVLKKDTVKYIDVGKLNETYFISLVAIGGIPQAIHDVQSESKTKWGRAAYFFNGAKYAMKQQPFTYEMKNDNHSISGESSLVVLS
ncbi:diacylglycerol kinase family protein, partial [Jeotgalibaca porci]|uniref:diacylglycerol/lipid kinase family protein n=1 Tax=Jeotgalibaca porci TaxID=1868793 RepID=UPI0035A14C72